jgi:hypothetical protein
VEWILRSSLSSLFMSSSHQNLVSNTNSANINYNNSTNPRSASLIQTPNHDTSSGKPAANIIPRHSTPNFPSQVNHNKNNEDYYSQPIHTDNSNSPNSPGRSISPFNVGINVRNKLPPFGIPTKTSSFSNNLEPISPTAPVHHSPSRSTDSFEELNRNINNTANIESATDSNRSSFSNPAQQNTTSPTGYLSGLSISNPSSTDITPMRSLSNSIDTAPATIQTNNSNPNIMATFPARSTISQTKPPLPPRIPSILSSPIQPTNSLGIPASSPSLLALNVNDLLISSNRLNLEVAFRQKCKLYILISSAWVEFGSGVLEVINLPVIPTTSSSAGPVDSSEPVKFRFNLVMSNAKTSAIMLRHPIVPGISLQTNGSARSWTWTTLDWASGCIKPALKTIAVKFKTEEQALQFKNIYESHRALASAEEEAENSKNSFRRAAFAPVPAQTTIIPANSITNQASLSPSNVCAEPGNTNPSLSSNRMTLNFSAPLAPSAGAALTAVNNPVNPNSSTSLPLPTILRAKSLSIYSEGDESEQNSVLTTGTAVVDRAPSSPPELNYANSSDSSASEGQQPAFSRGSAHYRASSGHNLQPVRPNAPRSASLFVPSADYVPPQNSAMGSVDLSPCSDVPADAPLQSSPISRISKSFSWQNTGYFGYETPSVGNNDISSENHGDERLELDSGAFGYSYVEDSILSRPHTASVLISTAPRATLGGGKKPARSSGKAVASKELALFAAEEAEEGRLRAEIPAEAFILPQDNAYYSLDGNETFDYYEEEEEEDFDAYEAISSVSAAFPAKNHCLLLRSRTPALQPLPLDEKSLRKHGKTLQSLKDMLQFDNLELKTLVERLKEEKKALDNLVNSAENPEQEPQSVETGTFNTKVMCSLSTLYNCNEELHKQVNSIKLNVSNRRNQLNFGLDSVQGLNLANSKDNNSPNISRRHRRDKSGQLLGETSGADLSISRSISNSRFSRSQESLSGLGIIQNRENSALAQQTVAAFGLSMHETAISSTNSAPGGDLVPRGRSPSNSLSSLGPLNRRRTNSTSNLGPNSSNKLTEIGKNQLVDIDVQRFDVVKVNRISKNTRRVFEINFSNKTLTIMKPEKEEKSAKPSHSNMEDDELHPNSIVITLETLIGVKLSSKTDESCTVQFCLTADRNPHNMKVWKVLFSNRGERERCYRLLQLTLLGDRRGVAAEPTMSRSVNNSIKQQISKQVDRFEAKLVRGESGNAQPRATIVSYESAAPAPSAKELPYKPCPLTATSTVMKSARMLPLLPLATQLHNLWSIERKQEGWKYGLLSDDSKKLHPNLQPYNNLPSAAREFNMKIVTNTLTAVLSVGFNITKSSDIVSKLGPSNAIARELLQLMEFIAENNHDHWAVDRFSRGYKLGPEKNDNKKWHPCLVAYSLLPEQRKQKYRESSYKILGTLVEWNYAVVKPESIANNNKTGHIPRNSASSAIPGSISPTSPMGYHRKGGSSSNLPMNSAGGEAEETGDSHHSGGPESSLSPRSPNGRGSNNSNNASLGGERRGSFLQSRPFSQSVSTLFKFFNKDKESKE